MPNYSVCVPRHAVTLATMEMRSRITPYRFNWSRTMLYGVTAGDPSTYVAVVGLLATVALLASYLPAHRASRTDPISVLRAD